MNARVLAAAAVLLWAVTVPSLARQPAPSDDDVRTMMIRESIDLYPGTCPCPFNTMRNGRSCGGRSAYSRPAGRSPLCYPHDISADMVARWRRSHGLTP